jgi:hypothetical protein
VNDGEMPRDMTAYIEHCQQTSSCQADRQVNQKERHRRKSAICQQINLTIPTAG